MDTERTHLFRIKLTSCNQENCSAFYRRLSRNGVVSLAGSGKTSIKVFLEFSSSFKQISLKAILKTYLG